MHDVLCIEVKYAGWQYTALTYHFPNLEPVCCSMSSSNCCFLTCRQISQEAGKTVWYSHVFKEFSRVCCGPQQSQRFWCSQWSRSRCFSGTLLLFYDPMDVGNFISGSSAFSKSNLNIWKFMVHILLKPSRRILSITLLVCEMSAIVGYFEYSLALPFFATGMKTDLFQSCFWSLLSFPNLLTYWVQHFQRVIF